MHDDSMSEGGRRLKPQSLVRRRFVIVMQNLALMTALSTHTTLSLGHTYIQVRWWTTERHYTDLSTKPLPACRSRRKVQQPSCPCSSLASAFEMGPRRLNAPLRSQEVSTKIYVFDPGNKTTPRVQRPLFRWHITEMVPKMLRLNCLSLFIRALPLHSVVIRMIEKILLSAHYS